MSGIRRPYPAAALVSMLTGAMYIPRIHVVCSFIGNLQERVSTMNACNNLDRLNRPSKDLGPSISHHHGHCRGPACHPLHQTVQTLRATWARAEAWVSQGPALSSVTARVSWGKYLPLIQRYLSHATETTSTALHQTFEMQNRAQKRRQ